MAQTCFCSSVNMHFCNFFLHGTAYFVSNLQGRNHGPDLFQPGESSVKVQVTEFLKFLNAVNTIPVRSITEVPEAELLKGGGFQNIYQDLVT